MANSPGKPLKKNLASPSRASETGGKRHEKREGLNMERKRVLIIGLDGFDLVLAQEFQAEGLLPNLARLQSRGASYKLDHGRDKYSGLAWEHFSSGKSPSDGARWSAITFDPHTYAARQDATSARPFLAGVSAKTVVFDVPYLDLSQAPRVKGLTNWGAHDPGVEATSQPAGLRQEMLTRFGPYPGADWLYAFCWPSAEKARASGKALTQAVELRSRAARWLLRERFTDWDLGVVVVSEGHSAIEPLWHGVDPSHPLHNLPSAAPAAAGLRSVYQAIDRLIGDLCEDFPSATIVVVAMHGMGSNDSDVAAMALLPELLYRSSFGVPYMRSVPAVGFTPDGIPLLPEDASWDTVMLHAVPKHGPGLRWGNRLVNLVSAHTGWRRSRPDADGLEWMPAARYRHFWPKMRAFALPSYYDGRIRMNVAGRETKGIVPPSEYAACCEQTIQLLRECRNLLSGRECVAELHWPKKNPHDVSESEADLYVVWESSPLGLKHSQLGNIGPVPYRRTGGHTGAHGFLCVAGEGFAAGHRGFASSFDVVPTVLDLLHERQAAGISGASLARELGAFP
jgi:predicted AlkP superfamily phosphohydrolase/phosphomutase